MENKSDIYHRMYEVWLYDQKEPEEKLFVGRTPPKQTPGWMLRIPAGEQPTEQEMLANENIFLAKHGINF